MRRREQRGQRFYLGDQIGVMAFAAGARPLVTAVMPFMLGGIVVALAMARVLRGFLWGFLGAVAVRIVVGRGHGFWLLGPLHSGGIVRHAGIGLEGRSVWGRQRVVRLEVHLSGQRPSRLCAG